MSKAPWHIWVVGVLGVLWNAFGCWDYTMTQLKGEEHLRAFGMTEAQIAAFEAMPAWSHGVWAIGVWGGMLGAILILLRRKLAMPMFVASFAGFLAGLVYQYALSDTAKMMPEGAWMMNVVIGAACVFFIWYAWSQSRKGVLR